MTTPAQRAAAAQVPDHTQRDHMRIYAPARSETRSAWAPHSRASRPDLLPWDLGVEWDERATLGEQLCTLHRRPDIDQTISPTRAQALALMGAMGLQTVPSARVADAPDTWHDVVVYTSDYGGHAGADKLRLDLDTARAAHPDALCVPFLTPDALPELPPGTLGWHERELVCGDHLLRARMTSRDWRSNHAATSLEWARPERRPVAGPHADPALSGPLYAIDFVLSGGEWYAIDFNINAGHVHAPLHTLPGRSIEGAVAAWSGWDALSREA